jgi:NAD-dependent SIR2 family protein deacetylase
MDGRIKRRKSMVSDGERRSRRSTVAKAIDEPEQGEKKPDQEVPPKKMTVGGVGGIRSGKDLFDVRCLSDPALLPAHHSLLNTLHRLTLETEPTKFHNYMKDLDDEGRLLRVYTQNIDGLEKKVGLDLRAPGGELRGLEGGRKFKRERSRKSIVLDAQSNNSQPPSSELRAGSCSSQNQGSETSNPQSRESTPSLFSSADESGASLSEAERALLESDTGRSRSTTPLAVLREQYEGSDSPDTPASARSYGTVRTDMSAKYGYLRDEEPKTVIETSEPASKSSLLPRAVPLHGVLATMDCTRCSFTQQFGELYPLPAELLSCPSCEENQEERLAANQRARSVGVLRASVLLYNEPSKHDMAIGEIVERDVLGVKKDDRPDLLIVAGTTLKIPGVVKIVKQLANALRMNYPDEKVKAKMKRRAANRKRKRKMRDEGTLLEDTDESEEESENEADDDPFTVDNFPIRTILLNRDAPGKVWEDSFDVWVQGDLQDFMYNWVKRGPTPAVVECSYLESMWKKGNRERDIFLKEKRRHVALGLPEGSLFSPGSSQWNAADKKKTIKLLNKETREWLDRQPKGWENQVSENTSHINQIKLVFRKDVAEKWAASVKLSSSTLSITEEVDESQQADETEPAAAQEEPPTKTKRKSTSKTNKAKDTAEPAPSKVKQKARSGRKPNSAKQSNSVIPFTASKPGTKGVKEKKADTASRQYRTGKRPDWNRLVDGSLSPAPPSEYESETCVKGATVPTTSVTTTRRGEASKNAVELPIEPVDLALVSVVEETQRRSTRKRTETKKLLPGQT